MARKQPSPKKQPKGDYDVGYCRPPKDGQIQQGEKRNPFGKNGKPVDVDVDDPLEFALGRKTRVTIDGETMLVSAEVAMDLRHIAAAMDGNVGSYNAINRQRSRRQASGRGEVKQTREEKEEAARKEIERARPFIELLDFKAQLKKQGIIEYVDGQWIIAPWVLQLMKEHVMNNPDAFGGGHHRDNWLSHNQER